MTLDFDSLGLTDIIRLQNQLSATLARRFERPLALGFSDIVESTGYFARFGAEAGRRLEQRHLDLLSRTAHDSGGRIIDTAGDGAFLCFPQVHSCVEAFSKCHQSLAKDNCLTAKEHQLLIRTAVHWGTVLTDDVIVTGDAVNLCARLVATTNPGMIRISKAAFMELPNHDRLHCRPLPPISLKGIPEPVEIMEFQWRDTRGLPSMVLIEETGERFMLPDQPIITFGRLREMNGARANDVVLTLQDTNLAQQLSRWHFELRREGNFFLLRSVSNQPTEVNRKVVARGEEYPVHTGDVIRLSDVMTLHLASGDPSNSEDDETISRKHI
jgi:class 3 adenylate cyclase